MVTGEHCWAIAKSHEMPRLDDGDGGVEGVAVLFVIVNCDLGTRGGGPYGIQYAQLLGFCGLALAVTVWRLWLQPGEKTRYTLTAVTGHCR